MPLTNPTAHMPKVETQAGPSGHLESSPTFKRLKCHTDSPDLDTSHHPVVRPHSSKEMDELGEDQFMAYLSTLSLDLSSDPDVRERVLRKARLRNPSNYGELRYAKLTTPENPSVSSRTSFDSGKSSSD